MKTKGALLGLWVTLFFCLAVAVSAQEKSTITVKGSSVNNGVVIVDVMKGGKGYDLQCNQGAPSCTQLKSGKYELVQLEPNTGMYDCKDVQVFAEGADAADNDKKLGEYCLNDK